MSGTKCFFKQLIFVMFLACSSFSLLAEDKKSDEENSSFKDKVTSVLDNIAGAINKGGEKVKDGVDGKVNSENVAASFKDAREASAKAHEVITPEQEYYIGRAVAANILAKYKVYNSPKTQKYLNNICHALTSLSERPELYKDYFIVILDTNEINAFATPGGHIMVTRGLLKCTDSEDAVAAVLAHEISHILLQHSVKAIKTSRAANAIIRTSGSLAVVATAGNDSAKENVDGFSDSVDDIVSDMIEHGYSKSQELAADTKALELMANAGYNPRAMDSMLKLIEANTKENDGGFKKTHPEPKTRLKNVSLHYGKYKITDTTEARKKRFAQIKPSF